MVLVIDTFEQSQALAAWLRTRFLPRLPIDALVVIAGRLPLDPDWRTDPDWNDALRVIALSDLNTVEAVALLAARGVPEEQYPSLLAFAGGQPLALTLAADMATQREFAPEDWRPNQEIVKTLLHSLVGRVPSLTHRQALEVCAHVEVTTEELLRSALGDSAADLYEWLRGLPFIECGRYGVYPHDVVRDVLAQDLRWRDPEGYGLLHRNIHDHLLGDVRSAAGSDVIGKTRSLLYLYRHASSVANYLTWTGRGEVYEADYLPEDRAAVLRLTSECEGAESARIAAFWLDRQPDAFHLQRRSETGEVVAFSAWLRLHSPEPDEIAADPVIAAAWRHCDTFGPIRPGEHIAGSRFTIDANAYGSTSPAVDLMIARVMAEWLRSHRIAWSFLVYLNIEAWDTQAKSVEHQPINDRVTVNDKELLLYSHDLAHSAAAAVAEPARNRGPVRPPTQRARPAIVRCVAPPPIRYRGTPRPCETSATMPHSKQTPPCGTGLADSGPVLRKLLTEAVQTLADDPRATKEYYLRCTPRSSCRYPPRKPQPPG